MSFKTAMASDASVFCNQDEFADVAVLGNVEIPVLIDTFESDTGGFVYTISFDSAQAEVLGIGMIGKGTVFSVGEDEYYVINTPKSDGCLTICEADKRS